MIRTTAVDRKKFRENRERELKKIINEEIDRRIERIVDALTSSMGANPKGD